METIQDTKIISSFKKVALILSFFTILIGLLVEIGWQFDIDFLRNFSTGNTFMNPLTALCFILIGLSIQFTWFARFAGLFIILVGLLKLEAIIFGFDIQIDQFLFRSKILENRIAPNTALAFIFIGTAIFFLAKDKYYKFIHILCLFTAVVSLLPILGYVYSVKNLYGILALTPMALNTAIAFFISSLSILFIKPDKGFMRTFSIDSLGSKTARILVPAMFIIPLVLGKLILSAQDLGFINTQFGFSLFSVLLTVIFLGLMYMIANLLNKIDFDRQQTLEVKYQSDEKLKLANVALDEELTKYRSQNKHLEDTEKAMLNILNDSKELEHELKVEKAGVEKKVEERTREFAEEQARLQASIESLSFGFIITDLNKNILSINQPGRVLLCGFGDGTVSAAQLIRNCSIDDISKFLSPAIDIKAALDQVMTKRSPLAKEIVAGSMNILLRITPIVVFNNNLQVIGAVVVAENITERKLIERTKDEFFSIASHELRTPLTAIRGNSSLIQQYYGEKLNDPELKEMVDDIHESSQRLIEIVNDFLDMSRLELGKIQFKKENVDLNQLAQDVIKEYQTTVSVKMLYLKFNLPKTPIPGVLADKDRVKQVLINLVGNAIKFTQKGGVTIEIQTDGKFVKTFVSDTGKGIPLSTQSLLFKKFQQAGENIYTRDSTRGTGLGLYISKLMIEGMGGNIALEKSVEGKGSVFSFVLAVSKG